MNDVEEVFGSFDGSGEEPQSEVAAPGSEGSEGTPSSPELATPEVSEAAPEVTPVETVSPEPLPEAKSLPQPETVSPPEKAVSAPTGPTQEQFLEALRARYAVSSEDATALLTEPESVLPKILARAHLQMVGEALGLFQRLLPGAVQQITEARLQASKAEDMFFGRWPELKGRTAEVVEMGKVYRQLNPKASAEQAVEAIGAMVKSALGMPNETKAPEPAKPVAFRPAGVGVARGPAPAAPKDPYNAFLTEMLGND
jgi:hypothetical protein